MKGFSLIALILMGACLVARYVLSYWMGYYENSFSPLAYRDVLVPFVEAIAILVIIICWIISLIRKRQRIWTTGIVLALLILMAFSQGMPTARYFIICGLRDRLLHDHSLDNLRLFAQEIERMPPQGNNKSFTRENLANTDLKEKYPFLSWSQGASDVSEVNGMVGVRWGGFIGHWGVNVAVNGQKLDLPSEPAKKALRLSDDIIVVSEPD